MIFDHVKNIGLYRGMLGALGRLEDTALLSRPAGKYAIDGERLFVIIQDYTTKPVEQCRWESHRKYIDIQYMLAGGGEDGARAGRRA